MTDPVSFPATQDASSAPVAQRSWRNHLGPLVLCVLVTLAGILIADRVVEAMMAAQDEVERLETMQRNRARRAAITIAREAVEAATATGSSAQLRLHVSAGALASHVRQHARQRAVEQRPAWSEQTWTTTRDTSVRAVCERFALLEHELRTWNPRLAGDSIPAGTPLVVFRHDSTQPSASVGLANRGRLLRGIPLPASSALHIRNPARAWGTLTTVDAILRGHHHVSAIFPDTPPVHIGDLSTRMGGRLRPHKSHQSGRDVDGAYYNRVDPALTTERFHDMHAGNLDVPRQWALFRYWIEHEDVTSLFVDRRLIPLLYIEARRTGASESLMRRAFGANLSGGIIRHAAGHRNHYHARFRCSSDDINCQ